MKAKADEAWSSRRYGGETAEREFSSFGETLIPVLFSRNGPHSGEGNAAPRSRRGDERRSR